MKVQFSKHALARLFERFPDRFERERLFRIIESKLPRLSRTMHGERVVLEGEIGFRSVKVVVAVGAVVTVITLI